MQKQVYLLFCALCLAATVHAQNITAELDTLLRAYYRRGEFNGSVLIARQGKILLEKGYGYSNLTARTLNDGHTRFQIASATKPFTSTLILKLVSLHKLSLDDKLSKFYPDYPKGDSITVENLLSHTSGIYDYTRDGDFMNNEAGKPNTEEMMMALFKDKPLDFSPGTQWSYSNSGYSMLGYIVPRAAGLSYDKAIRKYIFTPLKMDSSGFDFVHLDSTRKAIGYYADSTGAYNQRAPIVDSSVAFAAGAIYSTVEDLYKWHTGLQQYAIVNKTLQDKAYKPFKNNYGYGWIIDSIYGRRMVSHSGAIWGFRSNFARITEDDVCVILLCNIETPAMTNMTRRILAVLYHQPYTIPQLRVPVQVSAAVLAKYAGFYEIKEIPLRIEMKLENGTLVAYPNNGPRSELMAADATHFFLKDDQDYEIGFDLDESGVPKSMQLRNSIGPRTAVRVP
ncbi:serine hydrolase [Chitinophaga agrisoli]|uniref:Serine hydrolase n=1 Tax=Chitinophaga agrisoli TaxID=2607653 RepID=A0A5B2VQ94_9BACT|nr:serine hydrolase [Chitinophaga agrisoli]KAA2240576.1 serine hydrolase [Chitinophaga agrisoli]